jgi:hypothetical protein
MTKAQAGWAGLFIVGSVAVALWAQEENLPRPVPQPIAFPHRTHVQGPPKLQCKSCHPNPDPGVTMTFLHQDECMACHVEIKTDSPEIKKLAAFADSGRRVPWNRVYMIPDWVRFSHRLHLEKGNTCQECHGQVQDRMALGKETEVTSMAGCMTCHEMKGANNQCDTCHEPKQ